MKHAAIVLLLGVTTLGAWGQAPAAEPVWSGLDGGPSPALSRLWDEVRSRLAADRKAVPAPSAPVQTFVSGQPGAYSLVLQIPSQSGGPVVRYLPLGNLDERDALAWARTVEALLRFTAPAPLDPPPTLVDAFTVTNAGVDLPVTVGAPTALAVRGDRLWVALGSAVLEVNDRWMVTDQPSRSLSQAGLVNFAWSMAVSPAGTLVLRSADGTSLWSLTTGAGARSLGPGLPSAGMPLGVMNDGTTFALASQPKVARFWTSGGARDWSWGPGFLGADALVTAAAPGPDNTLWLWDGLRSLITVATTDGQVRNVVVPDLPPGTVVMRLKVDADGSFWAVTNQDLRRFRADGSLAWVWAGEPGATPGFGALADVAPGPGGLVYVSDFSSRRIYRLATRPGALDPALTAVARAAAAVRTSDRDAGAWRVLAETYAGQGALTAALDAWDRYLDLRPADAGARLSRLGLATALAKAQARDGAAETARLLESLGPESARDAYTRTMKTLEGLRAAVPGDPDVAAALADLRRRFTAAEGATPAAPVPRFEVRLASLFPSLLQVYRTKAAGAATVTNTLSEPLTDLSVEVFVPRYMDFPSAGPVVARLAPGAQAEVPVVVLPNDQVLTLEEDLPVQASVTLRWTDSRGPRSVQVARPLTLYRRTALTWDDTAHLASFVTPHDDPVVQAAFQLVPEASALPWGTRNFERAAALADGLGSLPLRYVPDPQTGYQAAAADAGIVDTVRFPRTTLAYRGGDCDDSTALLASFYESVGIPTAFLTTPGHVFLAFDTGEPAGLAWLFEGPGLRTVVRSGTVWVPVETTVLAQGFARAWSAASDLVARYEGSPAFAFVPVEAAQDTYRPLPLPASALPGPVFDPRQVAQRTQSTRKDLSTLLLGAGLTGNKLARLQATWGRPDLAQKTLEALVVRSPSTAAYLNLATLARAQGDAAGADRWVQAAQKAAASSTAPAGGDLVAAYRSFAPASGTPGRGAEGSLLPPWQE